MAELPVTLIPIDGGYTVHTTGCDCDEAQTPLAQARRRNFAASSVENAVQRLYSTGPVGVTAPDRFLRRECARNVPMTDLTPVPWGTLHAHYTKQAAQELLADGEDCVRRSRRQRETLIHSAKDADGQPVPAWIPRTDHLSDTVSLAVQSRLWGACLEGCYGKTFNEDLASRLVLQADQAIRDATELIMNVDTGHADPIDAAFAQIEKRAAASFIRSARFILARVHAHRATRDAIA